MAAIIRMKRKKVENQLNEVVVYLKRQRDKSADNEEETFSKKFKYAATVNSKDFSVVDSVQNAIREIKLNRFNNFEDVISKNQDLSQRSTKLIDYKIITKKRASHFKSLGNNDESDNDGQYFFFDLEENSKKESEADDSKEEKAEKDYVYDLYYINDQTFNYEYLDNICKFQATQQPDDFYNENDQDEEAYDEEDENAENYYTNQYPDPEDLALLNINEDDETSGDDEDGNDEEDDEEYNEDDYDATYYKPV